MTIELMNILMATLFCLMGMNIQKIIDRKRDE
jgi:hypothetical protein